MFPTQLQLLPGLALAWGWLWACPWPTETLGKQFRGHRDRDSVLKGEGGMGRRGKDKPWTRLGWRSQNP